MTLPGFIPRPSQDNTDEIVKLWRTVRALQKTSGLTGAEVAYTKATSNSVTWNSATQVVTNLAKTFIATAGATYRVTAQFSWNCAAASNMDAFAIGWRLGSAVASGDAYVGETSQRSHPDATGVNQGRVIGEFTAVSDGQHAVALIGWKPTGNTGASNLFTGAGYSANYLFVDRV